MVAVVHGDAIAQAAGRVVEFGPVGDDHGALHPFGQHLARDVAYRERAVHRLSPGHRHGIVVKDLEGHRDPGRHRAAHGQQARMIIGAVTHVLEYVRSIGEMGQAVPVRAFAAHLGVGQHLRSRIHRHCMATDAAGRDAAIGKAGAGIVRAPRTEIGRARRLGRIHATDRVSLPCQRFRALEQGSDLDAERRQPGNDENRDIDRLQLLVGGEQHDAVFVELANDARLDP